MLPLFLNTIIILEKCARSKTLLCLQAGSMAGLNLSPGVSKLAWGSWQDGDAELLFWGQHVVQGMVGGLGTPCHCGSVWRVSLPSARALYDSLFVPPGWTSGILPTHMAVPFPCHSNTVAV